MFVTMKKRTGLKVGYVGSETRSLGQILEKSLVYSWVVGWCDGAVLIWIRVGQWPTALAMGAGCLDIFTHVYHFSFLCPSLWETTRYTIHKVKSYKSMCTVWKVQF